MTSDALRGVFFCPVVDELLDSSNGAADAPGMARKSSIAVRINPRQVRAFEKRMAGLVDDAARPLQAAANATVRDARDRAHKAIDATFDRPETLTREAFLARQPHPSQATAVRGVSAAIEIKPLQNRWLKYALGDSEQTREPGEMGPADKAIMIPVWENLQSAAVLALGINVSPTEGGNMPPGTLSKLFSMTGAGGVLWWGRVRDGGKEGIWARTDQGPLLLVAAEERVTYDPVLQAPLEKAVRQAARGFAGHAREELKRNRWAR